MIEEKFIFSFFLILLRIMQRIFLFDKLEFIYDSPIEKIREIQRHVVLIKCEKN